jgi:hypothetical protein
MSELPYQPAMIAATIKVDPANAQSPRIDGAAIGCRLILVFIVHSLLGKSPTIQSRSSDTILDGRAHLSDRGLHPDEAAWIPGFCDVESLLNGWSLNRHGEARRSGV